MAKRTGHGSAGNGQPVNKSEAIRQMLVDNPKAPVREVVKRLAQSGVRVQPSLVYYIRGRQRHIDQKQRRQHAAQSAQLAGLANPVDLILKTKALAREAGGIHNLKQLIDALAE
jgi:hypothetical protein